MKIVENIDLNYKIPNDGLAKLKIKRRIFFGVFTILHFLSVFFIIKTQSDISPIQDALEYKILAQNILLGNGFSTSIVPPFETNLLRTPLYPLFLAVTYCIENSGILAIFIQQSLLILSGLLLFEIFLHFKKELLGYIFTALFLLEPLQWMVSLQTMSETFFTFLTTLSLYIILTRIPNAAKRERYAFLCLTGFIIGSAILTRPSGTLWLPGLALGIFLTIKDTFRIKFMSVGIFIFTASLLVLPWIFRNYALTGRPLLSSSYEYNVVIGFGNDSEIAELQAGSDIFDAKGRRGYSLIGLNANFYPRLKELEKGVTHRIGQQKIIIAQIMGAGKIWYNSRYDTILDMAHKGLASGVYGTIVVAIDYIFWSLILALCPIGVWELTKKCMWPLVITTALVILTNAVVTLTISYTRMRVPILPEIFLLAGFGAERCVTYLANFKKRV